MINPAQVVAPFRLALAREFFDGVAFVRNKYSAPAGAPRIVMTFPSSALAGRRKTADSQMLSTCSFASGPRSLHSSLVLEIVEHRAPRLRIRIKSAAETIIRSGHPWLFEESIREINREGDSGEIAAIYDRDDKLLALGLYDPQSPIRLRVLHRGKPVNLDEAWWRGRFEQPIALRAGLFGSETNGYRLINGESDGWPGLVLDRYDDSYVLKLYTSAWVPYLSLVSSIICKRLRPGRIVLRLSRNIQESFRAHAGRSDGETIFGSPPHGPVIFKENGLRFEADVRRGQKTGFFLDQRENRKRVAEFARDKSVLNAFSFSGGFSVYSAAAGARSVSNLDISRHALGSALRNFELNRDLIGHATHYHEIHADATEWLAGNNNRKFGVIILDPPSFAKREAERATAVRAYRNLVCRALKHIERDGVILACSCSAHVTAEEFWSTVRSAVARSNRRFEDLGTTQHAPDHPANFKEAEYLKAIYFRVR